MRPSTRYTLEVVLVSIAFLCVAAFFAAESMKPKTYICTDGGIHFDCPAP